MVPIEKLSDKRLDILIGVYDKGLYQRPICAPSREEILACLLETKQLRAEKRVDATAKKSL